MDLSNIPSSSGTSDIIGCVYSPNIDIGLFTDQLDNNLDKRRV